jgi:chromosome segregation ATPase
MLHFRSTPAKNVRVRFSTIGFRGQVRLAQAALKALQTRLKALQTKFKVLQTRLKVLQTRLKALQTRLKALQTTFKSAQQAQIGTDISNVFNESVRNVLNVPTWKQYMQVVQES